MKEREMKKQNVINNSNRRSSQGGFTLIETSIVIIILSFVMMPLFMLLNQQNQQTERRAEEAANARVLGALALFVRQNGMYPCPSKTTVAAGESGFGAASCSGTGITTVAGTGGDIVIGNLPIRDLSLPMRTAVNREGWRYIYAVSEDLTALASFDGVGDIIVNDTDGTTITANAHFVIVNTGGDGKGTFTLEGDTMGWACNGSDGSNLSFDAENCNGTAEFLDSRKQVIGGDPLGTNFYDDTIFYTLARKESTFWVASEGLAGSGGLTIVNRNMGNIGLGTNNPTAKVHVTGGNILVEGGNADIGGDVLADGDVTATGNIVADVNVTATQDITAGGNITAGNDLSIGGTATVTGSVDATDNITAGVSITSGAYYYE